MATETQKTTSLLALLMADDDALAALPHECGSDTQLEAWLFRSTRLGAEKSRILAPILRKALTT